MGHDRTILSTHHSEPGARSLPERSRVLYFNNMQWRITDMNNEQLLDLVKQMTLEEKTAQLLQLTANFYEGTDAQGQITGPMEEMGITEQSVVASGSILGLSGAQAIIDVQQAYLKKVVSVFRCCLWRMSYMVLKRFSRFHWRLGVHGIRTWLRKVQRLLHANPQYLVCM